MSLKDDLAKKKERTARKILKYAQDFLISFMPYFNRAILKMPVEFFETKPQFEIDDLKEAPTAENCGTDGVKIYCDPDFILKKYRESAAYAPRIYMHMVFHCLFYHPFQYEKMEFDVWDFACDVAVENTLDEMGLRDMELPGDMERRRFTQRLLKSVGVLTAENIYNFYLDNPDRRSADLENAELFRVDDHALWVSVFHIIGDQRYSERNDLEGRGNTVMEEWKQVGHTVRLNMESVARYREDKPGSAAENIKEVFRERYDYGEFLRRFVRMSEEMKIDRDQFDYIYYTYGMELYGNLPLIEPLEYKEEPVIRDFVIAIDTSGSCQGEVVRSFLNKTNTILKESGCFSDTMNVHILQCDSKIQHVERISSAEDFDLYIREIKVHGFGGTDFRPVFEYVNERLKRREFKDLRGVLYMTDGLGIYPKEALEYPVAFMIIEDPKEKAVVPNWAIKLYVKKNELLKDGKVFYSKD